MAIAIGLLKTILELGRSRKSGVLDAMGPARVRLFVDAGAIVFSDEGLPGDALRELLLREQVLTREQINTALQRIADLKEEQGSAPRLGEILVELKMLTPGQLSAARAAQVQEKIVRALGWPTAQFRFMESHGPLEVVARFPTPVEPLVLAALRLVDAVRIEELFAQSLQRFPALRTDAGARKETLERIEALRLRPPEREFVMSLDGTRSVREVFSTTAPIDPSLLTAALLLTDCLDLHGQPLASSRRDPRSVPKRTRTPFFGMAPPPKTTFSQTQPSAPQSSRPPSRPSGVDTPAPEEKERARTLTKSLRSAQDAKKPDRDREGTTTAALDPPTLPGLDSHTPQDANLPADKVVAEQAYQLARGHIRANRLPQALSELRRAHMLHPTPEYGLWVAWVELRADEKYDATRIEVTKRAAEAALAQDAALGFAYFVLGHIAFREGNHAQASELFERANSLEPALDDVRDVRLRATSAASTQGDVQPPAPLLTTPGPKPVRPIREAPAARSDNVGTDLTKAPLPPPKLSTTTLLSIGSEARPRQPPQGPEPKTETRTPDFSPSKIGTTETSPPPTPSRPAPPRPDPRPSRAAAPPASSEAPLQATSPPATARSPLSPLHLEEPNADSGDSRVVVVDSQSPSADDPQSLAAAKEEIERRTREDLEREEEELRASRLSGIPSPRSSSAAMRAVFAVVALVAAVLIAKALSGPAADTGASAPRPEGPRATSSEPEAGAADAASGAALATEDDDASTTTTSLEVDATVVEAAVDAATSATAVDASVESAAQGGDAGASARSMAVADAGELPAGTGSLDLPPAADGHRIYVDGRMIGVPPAPIVIACGPHVVRIGSAGRDHEVTIPCGGRLALPYP